MILFLNRSRIVPHFYDMRFWSELLNGTLKPETRFLILLERSSCRSMMGDADGSMEDCDEVFAIAEKKGYTGGTVVTVGEISFDPVAEAHSHYCWALIDAQDYPIALNAGISALRLKPDDHWMLFARALIRLQLGDSDAKDDFEKAMKINLEVDGECYAACLEALNEIKAKRQVEIWGKTILDTVIKSSLKLS